MSDPLDRLGPGSHQGRWIAAALVLGWLLSLAGLLSLNLETLPWWGLVAVVLLRTQLQTGLFIVGHDAMHGLLWPSQPRWNEALGAAALALYAALPYRRCRRNHHLHHHQCATAADPDFLADHRAGAWRWYRQFMGGYLTPTQMGGLLGAWAGLAYAFSAITPTALLNVLLICTLPLGLSSLQLFLVGTYLPHRRQRAPDSQSHPESLNLPPWLSLLACFHFGYHREHHDHPSLCWFQLPAARARSRQLALLPQSR